MFMCNLYFIRESEIRNEERKGMEEDRCHDLDFDTKIQSADLQRFLKISFSIVRLMF